MTVSELIETLKAHPGDLRIVVNGYEEGYDDLSPRQITVVLNSLERRAAPANHQGVRFSVANEWEPHGCHQQARETRPGTRGTQL